MQEALLNYLDHLQDTNSESAAGELLISFLQDMGGDGGNIWFATGDKVADLEDRTKVNSEGSQVSTYSREYLEWMETPENLHDRLVPKLVTRQLRPVRWGWDIDRKLYPKNSIDYHAAQVAFDSFGLRNCVIVPVRTKNRFGSSGFSFYADLDTDGFESLLQEKGSDIACAGYAAHIRMQSYRDTSTSNVKLTPRERESLLWLSKGLRTKQIADKMNIAQVTVTLHFTNAKAKLSARTREETLMKAVTMGLIVP